MKIGGGLRIGSFRGENWPHRLHDRKQRDKNRKGEKQSPVLDFTHYETHTDRKMRCGRGLSKIIGAWLKTSQRRGFGCISPLELGKDAAETLPIETDIATRREFL